MLVRLGRIQSAQDYYPFGMTMHNRRGEDLGGEHRYGFNGKEKDDEVHGSGNQYDYGFRIYNPRIARFLSVDPLFQSYPWYTPYQFAGNKPIWCIDIDGLEEGFATIEHTISKDGVTTIMWKVVPNFSPKPSDMGKVQYTYPDGRTVMKSVEKDGDDKSFRKTLTLLEIQRSKRKIPDSDREPGPVFEYEKLPPPPPPKPKPVLDAKPPEEPPIKTPVIKTPPVSAPSPSISKLKLDIEFNGNRKSFANPSLANRTLQPILKALKENSSNTVSLSPNTMYERGVDVLDLWGFAGDADTSDELVEMRGETIIKWFTDRGVNRDQIKISIDDENFENKINVTGTLTKYEKSE